MVFRTLILLAEADAKVKAPTDKPTEEPTEAPTDDAKPKGKSSGKKAESDPLAGGDGELGGNDDSEDEDDSGSLGGDTDSEDSEGDGEDGEDGGGLGGEPPPAKPVDPVGDEIRRGRLYDAVADVQKNCTDLIESAAFLTNRLEDATTRQTVERAKEILEEAVRQCTVLRTKFADLGYERVRTVYLTVRERVSAVAEIIKHVIDGDDDFRNSDSGAPK